MKNVLKFITLLNLIVLLNVNLVWTQNLVPNPQFEINRTSPAGYLFNNPQMECYHSGCLDMENLFRYSQAENWTLWLCTLANNACVMTELVKTASNCIPAGPKGLSGKMMHVKTTYSGMGIVNSDIPAGKNKVKVTCWVYVVKGKINMGYGPTGASVVNTSSKTNCKWEKLEITKTDSKSCNQVTLYADAADAESYVDAVSVIVF